MNDASPLRGSASPLFTETSATSRARRVPAIESRLMHSLAVHALDAGAGGQASIGLASIMHGEGATTIACNMASCLAKTLGQRVLIVDANQRSPALRQIFGLAQGPGLGDILRGDAPLEDALSPPNAGPPGEGRLLVLPASGEPLIPMAQMAGIMPELIAALLGYAELLVFDMAPLQPYPDSALIARHLDGMVVVLQAEQTKSDQSEAGVQSLLDGGANVLGAVLNRRRNYLPHFLDRLL